MTKCSHCKNGIINPQDSKKCLGCEDKVCDKCAKDVGENSFPESFKEFLKNKIGNVDNKENIDDFEKFINEKMPGIKVIKIDAKNPAEIIKKITSVIAEDVLTDVAKHSCKKYMKELKDKNDIEGLKACTDILSKAMDAQRDPNFEECQLVIEYCEKRKGR